MLKVNFKCILVSGIYYEMGLYFITCPDTKHITRQLKTRGALILVWQCPVDSAKSALPSILCPQILAGALILNIVLIRSCRIVQRQRHHNHFLTLFLGSKANIRLAGQLSNVVFFFYLVYVSYVDTVLVSIFKLCYIWYCSITNHNKKVHV